MQRSHGWLGAVVAAVLLPGFAQVAAAQTTLTVQPDVVGPGSAVVATVSGPPGYFFAIIGSSVGAGMSYGGVALGVGADVVILAQGVLGQAGQATVSVTPPFHGTVLDRYYLQAGTSPSPSFVPLSVSVRRVVRNGELVVGPRLLYISGGMVEGASVARAFCPEGMKLTGGGGASLTGVGIQQNYPIADHTGVIAFGSTAIGWQVAAVDWSTVQAFAICAEP
jgi:hypothetical protein